MPKGCEKQDRKRNIKGQIIAIIILVALFLLQVPYTRSALAGYEKEISENTNISGIIVEKGSDKSTQKDDDPAWELILVSPKNALPKDFTVDLLRLPGNHRVDFRIAPQVKKMFEDAKKDGVELKICSAFRTVDLQGNLYKRKVKEYISLGLSKGQAERKASAIVASAGTSEHHTGLAMDIISSNYKTLDEGFSKTAAFTWLNKNAHNYGFILRYPKNKQKITGITFEPWHYRYVGADNAKEIKNKNITLEEYLKK